MVENYRQTKMESLDELEKKGKEDAINFAIETAKQESNPFELIGLYLKSPHKFKERLEIEKIVKYIINKNPNIQ